MHRPSLIDTKLPKQPRPSLTPSQQDSIATSPSTVTSSNLKSSTTKYSSFCPQDQYQLVYDQQPIHQITPYKSLKCVKFHEVGYCPEGNKCNNLHEERGVKQISRDARAENPFHFINQYPDLMGWKNRKIGDVSRYVNK